MTFGFDIIVVTKDQAPVCLVHLYKYEKEAPLGGPGVQAHRRESPRYKGKGVCPQPDGVLYQAQHGEKTESWISAPSPMPCASVQCPACTPVLSSCVGDLDEQYQWNECG